MITLTAGLSPLTMLSSFVKKGATIDNWPQFSGRRVAFTQSCRTAIALLATAAGLRPGDEVLMSAYNCGSEVDALLAAGLRVRCVDCDEQGFLTIDRLERAVGPETRAVYIIHPFGWPQPLEEIDIWRREHHLLLFEDCALALFSETSDGVPLGRRGEASVYSFKKTLATPDGGAISWVTRWPGPEGLVRPPATVTWRQIASKMKQWGLRNRRRSLRSRNPALVNQGCTAYQMADIPQRYYFAAWRAQRRCATETKQLLQHVDYPSIRLRRRANYKLLQSRLTAAGIDLAFPDLPRGVCPLGCVVRTGQRDEVIAGLAQHGIEVSPWWAGGHSRIDWSRFPVASRLKRTLLPLPVHQELEPKDMEYIADALRTVCEGLAA